MQVAQQPVLKDFTIYADINNIQLNMLLHDQSKMAVIRQTCRTLEIFKSIQQRAADENKTDYVGMTRLESGG